MLPVLGLQVLHYVTNDVVLTSAMPTAPLYTAILNGCLSMPEEGYRRAAAVFIFCLLSVQVQHQHLPEEIFPWMSGGFFLLFLLPNTNSERTDICNVFCIYFHKIS